ncbi:MAG: permease [Bacillota bacterium]
MTYVAVYLAAAGILVLSLRKDPARTKQAARKSLSAFLDILPDFMAVLALIGLVLTILPPGSISAMLGPASGWAGMALASVVGSITLIPGFVAFPLAKSLLDAGAGVAQTAMFVTTLMAVGTVTAPAEVKYLGRKATLLRNGLAFAWAVVVALVLGVVVR